MVKYNFKGLKLIRFMMLLSACKLLSVQQARGPCSQAALHKPPPQTPNVFRKQPQKHAETHMLLWPLICMTKSLLIIQGVLFDQYRRAVSDCRDNLIHWIL